MKKLFLTAIIIATIFCTSSIGHTNDFAAITKNTEIAAALNALQAIGKHDIIAIIIAVKNNFFIPFLNIH